MRLLKETLIFFFFFLSFLISLCGPCVRAADSSGLESRFGARLRCVKDKS